MTRQRERDSKQPHAQRTSAPPSPLTSQSDPTLPTSAPLDQQPTARYDAASRALNADAANAVMTTDALPALDEPMTLPPSSTRTLASITTRHHSGVRGASASTSDASDAQGAQGDPTQQAQALIPLKADAERKRALAAVNQASGGASTLIPGARRYRPPTRTVVPRRHGPRSAVMQFAVAMIVTAMLISALTLSTPLGQAAALDINGPVHAYANAAPWIPTPTPKPTATSAPYRPPAGANPGQQAIITEIETVFGGYAQGALNVSKCESGYDPNAWNGYAILGSHASGVFQILYPSTWDTTSYASTSPFDADANIHAAYQIFQRDGYSWREWECQP